ncbi:bifunctional 2-polyprenyl-6-hydroxyphenol methylase/3-demethylubiquinol 3-O-methyltransferase UbiG [Magnetospirillum sp. UT-4]|uniref:class I SAM-dependent methyltransferase n=1 Tax=Magnetospirillum sp. UT-4 TaxID=2681467 RepID=UPI00138361ED|nr:class I SAM-dependent methyltransferase [Magnetospirillum sp. UT-4]CAA7612120.1 putative Methyltransferase family protein [Magnetospirillum sp. UT-4]
MAHADTGRASVPTGASTYSSAIATADRYTRWIVDAVRPYIGRRILEIGVGHGSYRAAFGDCQAYVGIDIDEAAVAEAQRRCPGGEYLAGDITSAGLAAVLGGRAFDTVVCINVLEHVRDDAAAIANLLQLLDPGGHLILFVPAFPGLYGSLDRLAGHMRRYRLDDLRRLVPAGAGEVVRSCYFNSIGGVGWWVNGLVGHASLNDPAVNGQIAVFDRFVVPISRLVDPVTRRFFGQSAICVVRR